MSTLLAVLFLVAFFMIVLPLITWLRMGEDAAPRFDLDPLRIKHMTAVTEPFRSELPSVAMGAALHEQPLRRDDAFTTCRGPSELDRCLD